MEQVTLHGGPQHGGTLTLPEGRTHFHVLGVDHSEPIPVDTQGVMEVPLRQGMYSRVGRTNDFEWDGWVGHV